MAINKRRFGATLLSLTTDGRTTQGGLNRPAFSPAHLAARKRFVQMIEDAGLSVHTDGAGNVSARWCPVDPEAPTLIMGSHLDSVVNGGRFDGTLGVAAAFEVLLALRDLDGTFNANVEVIDFTDEEGSWVSLLGSRAFCGLLTGRDLEHPHGNPDDFALALDRANLTKAGILGASRRKEPFKAYLELHIEQGTRLESSGINIGIVTGMVGIYKYQMVFTGTANHAGTTPMKRRRDALQGACKFTLQVRDIVLKHFPDCVANVGNMNVAPGASNIVPSSVTVALELRSSEHDRAQQLLRAYRAAAQEAADQYDVEVDFKRIGEVTPSKMDAGVQKAFQQAADRLNFSTRPLPSLAGHDAQHLTTLCPSGLVFVPSRGGFSHSPLEYTSWNDCVRGCQILFETARHLLTQP